MRIAKSIGIAVACLPFVGCVEILDLESLRPDPILVVNCVALTGEPLKASVSRTWFLTDNRPNVTLQKADVRLFVNDAFVSKMEYVNNLGEGYNSRGVFRSGYYPKVGDRIRVEAAEADYGAAWAETVVPRPTHVLSASESVSETVDFGQYLEQTKTYTVTFRDDASSEDYYLFRLESGEPVYDAEKEQYTGTYDWLNVYVNYAIDPIFGQSISSLDQILGYDWLNGEKGRVFSDELINGQEYTVQLSATAQLYNSSWPDMRPETPEGRLRVLLYTISKEYYFYMKALQSQSDYSLSNLLIDAGLAEPVQVYSNVEGGVGIVGACRRDTLEIAVKR